MRILLDLSAVVNCGALCSGEVQQRGGGGGGQWKQFAETDFFKGMGMILRVFSLMLGHVILIAVSLAEGWGKNGGVDFLCSQEER